MSISKFQLSGRRILVTGGSGFVGGSLNKHLAIRNKVFSLQIDQVPVSRLVPEVNYIDGDILTYRGSELPDHIDILIHSAALFPRNGAREELSNDVFLKTNVAGTLNMLELAVRKSVKLFIYISTGGVYGEGPVPFKESDRVNPISFYQVSKVLGEKLVQWYARHFSAVVLRVCMPYGPGGTHPAMIEILNKIKNAETIECSEDGAPIQNPVYIDDLTNITERACRLRGFHTFNVGGPERISRIELAEAIANILNIDAKIRYKNTGEGRHIMVDVSLLCDTLGIDFQVSFKEGIRRFVLQDEA